jgi:hypothetical protein
MLIEPPAAGMATWQVWLDDECMTSVLTGMQNRRRDGEVGETTKRADRHVELQEYPPWTVHRHE